MLEPKLDQGTIVRRNQEAKIVRRVVMIVLTILVLAIVGLGIGGYVYIKDALEPVDASSEKPIEVEIPIGTSTGTIAKKLEESGVIKSALVFKYYVKYKNENDFQAGNYELSQSMGMKDIITSLKDGKVYKEAEMTISIPEGLRMSEVIARIAKQTDYTEEEVQKKMMDKKFIEALIEKYPNMIDAKVLNEKEVIWPLEGYLFPATYEFYEKNPTLEFIIQSMVEKMNSVVTKYQAGIETSGYSTHQILTLASIIEEEAKEKEDRFKVSGVFYNRLQKGMPLQSDVTVTYAQQQSKITVTYKDTEVESPYNTYHQKGLPIGPIAAPGESSIKAAVNPEANPNYYFFARPNGEVLYAKTLDEHNKIKQKYIQEWRDLANKDKEKDKDKE